MSEWLTKIQTELADVTDEENMEPETAVASNDHVVGVASPKLRKLFYLFYLYRQKAAEVSSSAMLLKGEERAAKEVRSGFFSQQAELIKEIFWMSCRHDFPILQGKPNIGIRVGWEVVWTEIREESVGTNLADAIVLGSLAGMFRRALEESEEGDSASSAPDPSKLH